MLKADLICHSINLVLKHVIVYTPDSMVIRKINANNTLEWMASFSFRPIEKSLFIDSIEQCLYIGSYTNPLNILRLSPSTGALLDAQTL